jgi:hypothetical protein
MVERKRYSYSQKHLGRFFVADKDTDYRLPKRVRLTVACVYLSNYGKDDDQGVIAKAKAMLDEHNIGLDLWPDNGKKSSINTLEYGAEMVPDNSTDYKALRAAVDDKIKQGGCSFVVPLPVIFCQFAHRGYGVTPAATKATKLTPACLVSIAVNADKVTMVHEMGHAAGLDHEVGDDNRGNFMHEADPRSNMYRYQVEQMGKAMFAVG